MNKNVSLEIKGINVYKPWSQKDLYKTWVKAENDEIDLIIKFQGHRSDLRIGQTVIVNVEIKE